MMKPLITFDNCYAKAPKIPRQSRVPSTRNTKFECLEYEGTLTTSTVVCVCVCGINGVFYTHMRVMRGIKYEIKTSVS